MLPTALQVDTSDAFLVSWTLSEPGTGVIATTQETSPTAKATGTTTIRVCSMAYLGNQLILEHAHEQGSSLASSPP
jgi:hypothetical protein